jgi:hypothetical protein
VKVKYLPGGSGNGDRTDTFNVLQNSLVADAARQCRVFGKKREGSYEHFD